MPPSPVSAQRQLAQALTEARLAVPGDVNPGDVNPGDASNVRAMLATRICRLLPDLPADGRDAVTGVALRTLEVLAHDHVTLVRAALASAIKDIACAPPAMVKSLARDVERQVAEPILQCCAGLDDGDLLAIIAEQPTTWALSAIARRRRVSAPVSEAIVGAGDATATGVLLDNTGAVIPEATLERLVDDAAEHPDWQAKLARRPALPRRLALEMAGFVDRSVVQLLKNRPDFDDATVAEIALAVRRRVAWIEESGPEDSPGRRAIRLMRKGQLDDHAIGDALSWNEVDFVHSALALRAKVRAEVVGSILASGNPRAITALVWRAGFSMRCAMQVQARAANVPPPAMLNARDGSRFPLTPAEMSRQLQLYGIAA